MESDPGKLAEVLGRQEAPEKEEKEKSGPNVKDTMLNKESDDEGQDESVILNKSGKGTIPYRSTRSCG